MNAPSDPSLYERIVSLEARVAELHDQVAQLTQQHQARGRQEASAEPAAPPEEKTPPRPAVRASKKAPRGPSTATRVSAVLRSEDWLNKLGIALLLFGLAFLFKLGIDRGWLTPTVRIVFGGALGVFLVGAGLRLRPTRLRLGQVLLGGGIATFYVTLYAAYQFYSLLSYPVCFAGMALATLLGFGLAIRQNDAVLSVIATLGGLGTPFMLYSNQGNLPGLVVYTCILLTSAGGIYLYRGWRSLLWTAVFGGWLVMMVPWVEEMVTSLAPLRDRTAFQGGLIFCWLVFGGVPVLREVWRHRDPERWTVPPLRVLTKFDWVERPALVLAVMAPLVTLAFSRDVWDFPEVIWGFIVVAVAGGYTAAYVLLRQGDLPRLASAHGVVAAVLVALSWHELFEAEWLRMSALALEVALLHVLARALGDRALRFVGHVGGVIMALWLSYRLIDLGGLTPALVNGRALVDLVVLGLLLSVVWTLKDRPLRLAYALAAYVGLLGWFWRDLVALPSGQAYVSIAWGVSALALLALGWRRDVDEIRNAGLVTLLVVVAKLFLVDLEQLDAVWRILLFLGFGGLLLLLSYFFPRLWKPEAVPPEEEGAVNTSAEPPL